MAKNMAFKAESERLLKQAEEDAYAPLKKQIREALQKIGKAKGYAFYPEFRPRFTSIR